MPPRAVFLSPHHDDVCYSLAGTVAAIGGGDLVDLFTRSTYVERAMPLPADPAARVEAVTRLRAAEDEAFAARCGLERHDLGLDEPGLRGRTSFDLRALRSEVERLSAPLLGLLERLAARDRSQRAMLFCPLGIGGHVNHVATLVAVAAALPRLSPSYRVYFYEDLHYASRADAREAGLERARRALRGAALVRRAVPLSPRRFADKLALVALYRSQHRGEPDPSRFTPAAPGAAGPHEAVWSFAEPPGARREPHAHQSSRTGPACSEST